MGCFFRLIEQFRTQDEPAFCGLGSLARVLNALNVDPMRIWKGPWRWVNESMPDCCEPQERIKQRGIAFSKLACLALCHRTVVEEWPSPALPCGDLYMCVCVCVCVCVFVCLCLFVCNKARG